ncbi:MAG: glycosyltransferase family 39 protein, partial [Candidatus Udaeobacter sp.]
MTHKIDINGKALHFGWCILAVIAFGFVLAIRIRLLGIPLERDEGEYAYAGQLMLQGIPPYKLAYNMKFPGTYAAYAAIMSIFGQTIFAIHLGLLLVNAITIALIFLLGRRLMNSTAGIAAATTYAVLSVSPSVLGLAAHATNFVMVFVLGGTLLMLRLSEPERHSFERLSVSGLLFGIGALMKQPALLFIPFGAIYLLCNDVRQRLTPKKILLRNLIFWIAAILPIATTCLILWHTGVLDKFWFWTVRY